jgi:hypothetical protein
MIPIRNSQRKHLMCQPIVLSSSDGTKCHTLRSKLRTDENNSLEGRSAPGHPIVVHVHDCYACEGELVKRSLATCSSPKTRRQKYLEQAWTCAVQAIGRLRKDRSAPASRSALIAVSKLIYTRDQNDCDEARVSVYCASVGLSATALRIRMRLGFTMIGIIYLVKAVQPTQ